MIIAIDFDGTCVTQNYPDMGKEIGAAPVIKSWSDRGHQIILLTMRDADQLEDAIRWFWQHDIPLFGINNNPEQHLWTESKKVYANVYVDDANLGIPLTYNCDISPSPFVNWQVVEILFKQIEEKKIPHGNTFLHKDVIKHAQKEAN